MKITSYSIHKLRNGYWSARVRMDSIQDIWSADSFHDREEAEAWVAHIEHTLAGIEDFKVSNSPHSGTRQNTRTPGTPDSHDRKDRST